MLELQQEFRACCVSANGDWSLGVMRLTGPLASRAGCREVALPQSVHEDVNFCQLCTFFADLLH